MSYDISRAKKGNRNQMIDIALADKFLNSDFMDLDCAAKSVNLNKETILADLGMNRFEAKRIKGKWYFNRQDFFVYYYFNYGAFEESDPIEQYGDLDIVTEKSLSSDDILSQYAEGERDFSEKILVNQPDFSGACLKDVNFYAVNLVEANFENADLENADLCMTTLYKANLRGANLKGSWLEKADLRHADLTGAILDDTSFVNARLDEIRLEETIIRNTKFFAGISLSK